MRKDVEENLDFADIRTYGSPESPGIVVLRLAHQHVASVCILEPHRTRSWRAGD